MMIKLLKFLAIVLFILIGVVYTGYTLINQPLPEGEPGPQAEQLTDKMFRALNKPAYDSIRYIEFSFKGIHSYQWNKKEDKVVVRWDDQKVVLNLGIGAENYSDLEYKAYKYFINDSFWLVAPFKARDDGVTRSIVEVDGGDGLLVSYSSGGVTPGDSYLWILDEKGFPKAWKLWTSNVPIGGLKFSWEGWSDEGAYFSTLHKSDVLDLDISNLVVSY